MENIRTPAIQGQVAVYITSKIVNTYTYSNSGEIAILYHINYTETSWYLPNWITKKNNNYYEYAGLTPN